MIAGTYNAGLVALSVLIAMAASYAGFNLGERVSAYGGQRRWLWLASGAVAMGSAIWSMHYVGMLAFVLPVPVLYHVPTVILSLIAAVAGAAVALYVVSEKTTSRVNTAIGGVCLGGAIASMHYIGMAAMRSAAMHRYSMGLVILSVVIAITFSCVAVWLAFTFGRSHQEFTWIKLATASLTGVGIASMHYTAMAAAHFMPGYAPLTRHTVQVSTLGAFGIGMTTLLLLATVLVTSWIDRRLANERLLRHLYSDLEEREAKIRRLVDANIIGIFIWELEGRILEANDAFLRMMGYDRDDLVSGGLRWTDLTPPEWPDRESQQWVPEMKKTGSLQPFEKEYLRKDGSRVPVLIGAAGFDEAGSQGVAFVLDLTERKRAETERERLRQLEADLAHINRVSMMGELAGSLAHELKQPIAAAISNAEACLYWLVRDQPDFTEMREAAAEMIKDAKRAADILDRVRSLYRRETPQRELVDVNDSIREMILLLHEVASQQAISIDTNLHPALPAITGDRVQMQQVLMNLMLNGIEAMKDTGGELTVTSNKTEDGQILLSVRDSGIGLPVENAERIFDTFFTTKVQGTGMGLSICRRIIESHGGRLWASANSGRGATFQFTIPTKVRASAASAGDGIQLPG